MINNDKLIAIYSRKSKYTGKGESIENQIEMCKTFIVNKYGLATSNKIVIFEDEGFTGANTNRPQFQQMLTEFKKGNFKMLVVYRLDRVSRNVLDFCSLKDLLTKLAIDFVSITENFDTSTPMGTAMLMITSVFAQLERDTIAERIKDNMYELAKTGRWLGGNTPLGYLSTKKEFISIDHKKRNLYQLTFDKKEITKVQLIFSKYQELKSLSKLESYLIKNNIKTRNNIYFSPLALVNILKNIVYCQADNDIKRFLETKGIDIYPNNMLFDGRHGLISYNKRISRKSFKGKLRKNDIKNIAEWVIAIGKHQGIIPGKDWIKVWQMLEEKKYNKRSKKINGKIEALLSGLLKCQKCGSFMRPKILKTINSNGIRNFSYICELKAKSRKLLCDVKNINGNELDHNIINWLMNNFVSNNNIITSVKNNRSFSNNTTKDNEYQILINIINSNCKKIEGLIDKLSLADELIAPLIMEEIKVLQARNRDMEKQLPTLKTNDILINEQELDTLCQQIINDYHYSFEKLDLDTRRDLIKKVVNTITYDGTNIYLN
jgi:site-specific DNA recombinase